jgi:Ca2+-binding RTX toxin-like protein
MLVVAGAALVAGLGIAMAYAHSASAAPSVKAKVDDGKLIVTGTGAGDVLVLRLAAGSSTTLEVDVGGDGSADLTFDRNDFDQIRVRAKGGDDSVRIDDTNGVFTNTEITRIRGGAGGDILIGGLGAGSGAETYFGGGGNDTIDGNRGNDIAFLGPGNDTFIWDPGDGNDILEGEGGTDTMLFNGAGARETVDVSANGKRLRFSRQPGNVLMDTNKLERVEFNALGGADTITVNDLAATDVTDVNLDLEGAFGSGASDGQADQVIVNATPGDDNITVAGGASGVNVTGLAAAVNIFHSSEGENDRLDVNTLEGNDTVDSSGLQDGFIRLFVDGVEQ